eukprot:6180390-Pleurochrysis_carterae.AAC.4
MCVRIACGLHAMCCVCVASCASDVHAAKAHCALGVCMYCVRCVHAVRAWCARGVCMRGVRAHVDAHGLLEAILRVGGALSPTTRKRRGENDAHARGRHGLLV